MILATLILITSAALWLFFLQTSCQRILRREFGQEYFHPIVNANRLEFPYIRQAVEEFDVPIDYERFRMQLKCDFLALTYLLKNAINAERRLTRDEYFLMAYFKVLFAILAIGHTFGFGERAIFLKLTSILEYFGNVLGLRVSTISLGNMTASEYLLSL